MKPYIFILSLVLLLVSCEKELDITYNDVESQLVIEAILSEEGSTVSLSRTVPMVDPLKINKLTDASIRIKDITGNRTYSLAIDKKVFFYGGIPDIPRHEYSIEVTCKEKPTFLHL